jgi:biotin carboxyl carrier protein
VRADLATRRRRMSTRNRILFFVTAWLIVLMPFLFWWGTWFGRSLSDKQLTRYLADDAHPRHIQHALVQIGERMSRRDAGVAQWYSRVTQLSSYPVEQVRNTDAWVMGQDTSSPAFHDALLRMLGDSSLMVRGNAALSLVRFGDVSGRPQIVALLEAARVTTPESGKVLDASVAGMTIHQGGVVVKLRSAEKDIEVRSPISGRLRAVSVQPGQTVDASTEVAVIDPGADQVWEALRALYVVGEPEDLTAIARYERESADIPDHVRKQAIETDRAIRHRQNEAKQ